MFNKKMVALSFMAILLVFNPQPVRADWKTPLATGALIGSVSGVVVNAYDLYCINSARKASLKTGKELVAAIQALALQEKLIKSYDEVSNTVELTDEANELMSLYDQVVAYDNDAVSRMKTTVIVMAIQALLGTWAGYTLYHTPADCFAKMGFPVIFFR